MSILVQRVLRSDSTAGPEQSDMLLLTPRSKNHRASITAALLHAITEGGGVVAFVDLGHASPRNYHTLVRDAIAACERRDRSTTTPSPPLTLSDAIRNQLRRTGQQLAVVIDNIDALPHPRGLLPLLTGLHLIRKVIKDSHSMVASFAVIGIGCDPVLLTQLTMLLNQSHTGPLVVDLRSLETPIHPE